MGGVYKCADRGRGQILMRIQRVAAAAAWSCELDIRFCCRWDVAAMSALVSWVCVAFR